MSCFCRTFAQAQVLTAMQEPAGSARLKVQKQLRLGCDKADSYPADWLSEQLGVSR